MIGTMKATPLKMRDSEHEGKDASDDDNPKEGAGCFKSNQCGMTFETLRQRSSLMGAQASTPGSLTPQRPNTGGMQAAFFNGSTTHLFNSADFARSDWLRSWNRAAMPPALQCSRDFPVN